MINIRDFEILTNAKDIPSSQSKKEVFREKIKYIDQENKTQIINGAFDCIRIETFSQLYRFIRKFPLDNYIFRGQRCYNWLLLSTLERSFLAQDKIADYKLYSKKHLERFKKNARGKIQSEYLLQEYSASEDVTLLNELELWAIGQHLELNSKLLDWTFSFFIALFFAFEVDRKKNERGEYIEKDDYRVICCLPYDFMENNLLTGFQSALFQPKIDPYKRLTAQQGLFSNIPFIDQHLIDWSIRYPNFNEAGFKKIFISNNLRSDILLYLQKYNINYLTVYPDLQGVIKFCNSQLDIA